MIDGGFITDLGSLISGVQRKRITVLGTKTHSTKEYKKGCLESSTQTEDQMKSGLLLDVVIREGTTVFQLLSGEDQTLLIWGNSLLVLDLSLHVLNGVRGLHIESDGLSSKSLDEDLHWIYYRVRTVVGPPTVYSVEKSANSSHTRVIIEIEREVAKMTHSAHCTMENRFVLWKSTNPVNPHFAKWGHRALIPVVTCFTAYIVLGRYFSFRPVQLPNPPLEFV